jgi:hypothetical protein
VAPATLKAERHWSTAVQGLFFVPGRGGQATVVRLLTLGGSIRDSRAAAEPRCEVVGRGFMPEIFWAAHIGTPSPTGRAGRGPFRGHTKEGVR